jgi:hypothetical protein
MDFTIQFPDMVNHSLTPAVQTPFLCIMKNESMVDFTVVSVPGHGESVLM